ncbi:hypothetical protein ACS0TY_015881 [Phlomoides rotata]
MSMSHSRSSRRSASSAEKLRKRPTRFPSLPRSVYLMQLNAYMIKVLQAQDDLVNSMREAASKELFHVSHHHHSYEHVLKDLIVQDALIVSIQLLKLEANSWDQIGVK